MQTVHAVSYQQSQGSGPPKQKSYPAYCDVNPGLGPGVTKMAPYAEHTVTSYNTPSLKPPSTLPLSQPLSKPPSKQQLSNPVSGPGLNRKLSAPAEKNHAAVNGQNKSRGRSSPTRQPQFIDPPEEFVFSATKVMRWVEISFILITFVECSGLIVLMFLIDWKYIISQFYN